MRAVRSPRSNAARIAGGGLSFLVPVSSPPSRDSRAASALNRERKS